MGMAQDQTKPSKPGKLSTGPRSGGWEEGLMGATRPPRLLGLLGMKEVLPRKLGAAVVERKIAGVEESEAENE
jgi:hypothetical protein